MWAKANATGLKNKQGGILGLRLEDSMSQDHIMDTNEYAGGIKKCERSN